MDVRNPHSKLLPNEWIGMGFCFQICLLPILRRAAGEVKGSTAQ